jgi:hypothetical protein
VATIDVQGSTNLKNQSNASDLEAKNKREEKRRDKIFIFFLVPIQYLLFFCFFTADIKIIDDAERVTLIKSDDFMTFFTKNTRILERALDQDDIFLDYGGVDTNKELVMSALLVLKMLTSF